MPSFERPARPDGPQHLIDSTAEARSREKDPVSWKELEDEERNAMTSASFLASVLATLGEDPDAPMIPVKDPLAAA